MKQLALLALFLLATGSLRAQSPNLQGANARLEASLYQTRSEKGAASGYAGLNSSSLVPPTNLFPSFTGSPDGTIWVKSGSVLAPVSGSGVSAAGDALTLSTVTIGNTGIASTRGISVNSGTSPLLFKAGSSNKVYIEYGQAIGGANSSRNAFLWSIAGDGTFALKAGTLGGTLDLQSNNATNIAQASGSALVANFSTSTLTAAAGNITLSANSGAGGIIIPSTGGSANPTWALNTTAATTIFGRKDLINTWATTQTFSVAPVITPDSVFTIAKTTGLQAALDAKLSANGSVTATAALPMGGFKITGLATATASGDAVNLATGNALYAPIGGVVNSLAIAGGSPATVNAATGTVTLTLIAADATHAGYLPSANWVTFNAKESALTFLPSVSGVLTRSGNTITLAEATTSQSGYLTAANWTTFNAKESALTFSAPLSRSTNTISMVAASDSVAGSLAAADYTKLQSISTGYTNGYIPIGNGSSFTKAAITAGDFITVTNGAGSITLSLNDAGYLNGELLIGDTGLHSGAGGLRKGTLVAGSGIGITTSAGSITIAATGGGASSGFSSVATASYQLVPAADPSAVEVAYTAPMTAATIVAGKFFKVTANGRITATASGDKFSFWLYYGAVLVAGPIEYTTSAAETDEPIRIVFENTVRSTGGGVATVYTYSDFSAPKTATRSTSVIRALNSSITNFPVTSDNLTIKVQSDSTDSGAGITSDRIVIDQAYLHSN